MFNYALSKNYQKILNNNIVMEKTLDDILFRMSFY